MKPALLGDLVGYGAEPGEVLQRCMRLVADEGALAVLGNHDDAALAPPAGAPQNLGEQSAQWTAPRLDGPQRAFMAGLPLTARAGPDVLLVHASADGPERWHHVTDGNTAERSMAAATQLDPAIRYVFGGHLHEQALYFFTPTGPACRCRRTANGWPSSVRAASRATATYALFDAGAAPLIFHCVAYDHLAAVRASGLPEFFAERLEKGR